MPVGRMSSTNVTEQRMPFGRMLREGTWLCEGLLDEGNFVARVFDEKITFEYVRTYLTLVFKCCILHLINVALALVFSH